MIYKEFTLLMEYGIPCTADEVPITKQYMFVLSNVATGATSHTEVLTFRILKILLHKMYGNSWLVKKVQLLKTEPFP